MSLITIRTYLDRTSTEIERGLLSSYGIEAVVMTDNEGGLNPGLSTGTGVRLMVNEDQAEKAVEILEQEAEISTDYSTGG